jgi:HPt (histidine-containing phosphotransfer) domain-containing protein
MKRVYIQNAAKRRHSREEKTVTIQALEAYGADVKSGLARCMGMEDFYLRLVTMELADVNFDKLDRALAEQDAKAGFEAAHALKGAVGNLGLTPLFAPLSEISEKLRSARELVALNGLEEQYREALAKLRALAKEQ